MQFAVVALPVQVAQEASHELNVSSVPAVVSTTAAVVTALLQLIIFCQMITLKKFSVQRLVMTPALFHSKFYLWERYFWICDY